VTVSGSSAATWFTRLAVAGGLALAWGMCIERRWYVLRWATLPVLAGSAEQPLRVLHLSDLHQLPRQEHRLDFVRRCAEAGPDVVVVTGDLLESDDSIDEVVAALGQIVQGRLGIVVLGAHDYWGAAPKNPAEYLFAPRRRSYGQRLDTQRLINGLTDAGYTLLDNRRETLKTPAGLVDVAGDRKSVV